MSVPLVFSSVAKRYSKRTILRCVNLQIDAGEIVGLMGINGAGKSTLLKSMLDLTSIDDGHIEIFGTDHRHTKARQPLAYLAEHFVAPHYATGYDFLKYVCRLHRLSLNRESVAEECANLELDTEALSRPAREYSKGMMQKLGLIGCLLTQRPLIILDEPMSGLDPKARALFNARLARLKQAGRTIFFSTHLLDDVAAVADKVAILDDGRIRFYGTLKDFQTAHRGDTLEQSFLRCISSVA